MIKLTPAAQLVALALIALPISLYAVYIAIEVGDKYENKDNLTKLEESCIVISNFTFTTSMCMSGISSACISITLLCAILSLLL